MVPLYKRVPQGEQPLEIIGYRTINAVSLKERKLDAGAPVLDEAVQQDANQVYGLS
jgi:uncharacterized protein YggE